LFCALSAFAQDEPAYRLITDPRESAQPAALEVLKHLAAGNIEAASTLSNAPQRRLEVLREFRSAVGEKEFKRLFGRYFAPENRIVMEAAIGARRLIVWDLGEDGHRLAGQYYVEMNGKFVMDDVPNEERVKLQRVLERLRNSKAK
jgi:hypothetical protein